MGSLPRKTAIDVLASISEHSTGTSFVLMMQKTTRTGYPEMDYSFHPRFNQPCQGGELRKYGSTHPTECTQPHNRKPGDLWHPFPDNTPAAVAFPLGGKAYNRDLTLRRMFHKDSPFLKGFGSVSNVRLLINKNDLAYGFIIGVNDLRVDPTVMVHMVQAIRNSNCNTIKSFMDAGASFDEAIAISMLNNGQTTVIGETYEYYFSSPFSVRRYFEGKPNDLSGGSYHDRTDYNRTYVQDVFKGDVSDGAINWSKEANKHLKDVKPSNGDPYYKTYSVEQIVAAAKKVFAEALLNEKEVEEKPYVYRNAKGEELPTPVIGQKPVKAKKAKAA